MDDDPVETEDRARRRRMLLVAVCVILIANFLWRVLTPVGRSSAPTDRILIATVDLILIGCLVWLRSRVPQFRLLFWIALAAGIGLFVLGLAADGG